MTAEETRKLEQVVFERLVCGEDRESLRAQLATRDAAEAERIVAAAEDRIARGHGTPEFARLSRRIRKRRLVGGRYLVWKVLAWVAITGAILSVLASMLTDGQIGGPFFGIITGGIILAVVEEREKARTRIATAELAGEPRPAAEAI